jgi:predicted N-acetyltransferase YhbS
MLSDGKYYGAIYDVIVDPEYHGNGIGKLIMNDIIDQGKHMTYVTLFAVPGKLDFYQRLGFKKMSTAMIIPRNENMENIYCEC